MTAVNCAYCRDPLGDECVEGGYCSERCRGLAEHEQKLREHEVMSIGVHVMDDGSHSVQVHLRGPDGFREMARNYETAQEALLGVAQMCTAAAESFGDES